MARFNRGFDWRTVITDLDSQAITMLDKLSASRTITYPLNKPATTAARVPSDDPRANIPFPTATGPDTAPGVSFNDRLAYMFRREAQGTGAPWVCRFAGILEQIEDSSQEDQPYSNFTAWDPWQYLYARPVMDGGDLVGPAGLQFTGIQGSVIAKQLVDDTIALHGSVYIDTDAGIFEATDAIDINFQQGLSVGAALQQLCATGTLDIVMEPVYDHVGAPGICCVMNVYAQAGAVRNDVIFSWGIGRSVTGISSLLDGDQMANTVQLYNGQGGDPVTPAFDATSEGRYGWWEAQQFFPGQNEVAAVESMAEFQLELRKQGKRTVRLSPSSLLSPIPLLDYGLGDRVPVYATARLRQAIPWATDPTVYTRIYGIPITLSDDGVEQVSNLVTSPDGFS